MADLKTSNLEYKFPSSKCFCCTAYDTIHYVLVKLINDGEQKLPKSSPDGFLKMESFKGEEGSYMDDEDRFNPIGNSPTKNANDLTHSMVFGNKTMDHEFVGMYYAILTKLLGRVDATILMLPASNEVKCIWANKLRFRMMDVEEVQKILIYDNILKDIGPAKGNSIVHSGRMCTNSLIRKAYAPSFPEKNITYVTRLEDNRALEQVSERLGLQVSKDDKSCDRLFVEDPVVFGQIWIGSFTKVNKSGSGHSQRVTDLIRWCLFGGTITNLNLVVKCEREFHVGCLKEHNMTDLKLINDGEQKLPKSSPDGFIKVEFFKGEEGSYLDEEV
ncbi:hypothetical protein ACFE04_002421 [Oxalis oulophora]